MVSYVFHDDIGPAEQEARFKTLWELGHLNSFLSWYAVGVKYVEILKRVVRLEDLEHWSNFLPEVMGHLLEKKPVLPDNFTC